MNEGRLGKEDNVLFCHRSGSCNFNLCPGGGSSGRTSQAGGGSHDSLKERELKYIQGGLSRLKA